MEGWGLDENERDLHGAGERRRLRRCVRVPIVSVTPWVGARRRAATVRLLRRIQAGTVQAPTRRPPAA